MGTACEATSGSGDSDSGPAGGKADDLENLPLALASVDDAAVFDAISFRGQGGVLIGKSIKFIIDNRDPAEPIVRFMNANYGGGDVDPRAMQYHYFFSEAVLEGFDASLQEFDETTYWTQDKQYFAGTIQEYRLQDDEPALYGVQFYPQDVIAEETVLEAVQSLAPVFHIDGARVGFVATGPQQTTARVAGQIEALGFENLTLDQVLGSLNYIPMQLGEAWGYLRIFPPDQDLLSAIDIPVFDELPLTLTVVAGSMTRAFQDASSHINLKSKERGTPNMVLRDAALDHERLAPFADQPIHLTVAADGYHIELSTDEEVREKLAERMSGPWRPVDVDPTAVVTSYDDMCSADARGCLELAAKFGGKAGNLGLLRHRSMLGTVAEPGTIAAQLGYEVTAAGFGVPVQRYFDFVNHPDNVDLRQALDEFIALEKEGVLAVAERVEMLDAIRAQFLAATLPEGLEDEIRAMAAQTLAAATESLKIRSSANAEDIPDFDGAGLYDSFRAKLGSTSTDPCRFQWDEEDQELEIRPRTIACAVKGVYASLWNKRAVEERSFARIDHATAGMGLAVVRRYQEHASIAANSVVVTRVLNSSGVSGYTFSSQVENNVVTNPAPGTQSETIMAGFLPNVAPTFTVTRFAKPDPNLPAFDQPIMTPEQLETMLALTRAVESTYCELKPSYYDGNCQFVGIDPDKPVALDMELKLYDTGEFLCKQVREFAGR